MGVQEHEAQTKTDRLIAAFERLCDKLDEISEKLERPAAPANIRNELSLPSGMKGLPIPVVFGTPKV